MKIYMEGRKGAVDEDTKEMIVHLKWTVCFLQVEDINSFYRLVAVLMEGRIKAIVAYDEVPYWGIQIFLKFSIAVLCQLKIKGKAW
jgi:hypothetical protein